MGPTVVAASIVTAVSVVLGAGTGWSYWTAQGTGAAFAGTGEFVAPADVTAATTTESAGAVVLSWSASTVASGDPEQGYRLTRIDVASGDETYVCGTRASTYIAATRCSDETAPDGTYRYRVTAVHRSWTAASPWSEPVRVDTVAPGAPTPPDLASASDSGDSDSDDVTNDDTPTFTGTAEPGAHVTLLVGTIAVGVGTATDGTYSVTTSGLADGARTVTATATDAAGNTSAAAAATEITVDTVRPTLTAEQQVDQADPTNTEPIHFALVFSEPVLGLTAADLVSSVAGTSLTLTGTGATYDVAVGGMGGDGEVRLSVGADAATDVAGNSNTASTSGDNGVTRDTSAPDAPSTPDLTDASDSGSFPDDEVTRVSTPAFAGVAETGSSVTIHADGVEVGTGLATDGTYSIVTTLTEGAWSITASTTDLAGNTSESSASLTVTLDTTSPATPSTPDLASASDSFSASYAGAGGSTDSDDYTSDATPLLTGTAEPGAAVALDRGGDTFLAAGVADADGAYAVQVQQEHVLADGVHEISAVATDLAGNSSAPAGSIALTVDTAAPAATVSAATYSATTGPDSEDYRADFAGATGTDTGDGPLTVLLCTSADCDVPVPAPAIETTAGTWSRSSDQVFSCTLAEVPVCGGTDRVFVRASQLDRAGNTTVVVGEVVFPVG